MKSLSFTIITMSLLAGICQAGETIDLSSKEAKSSYSIGYQVGSDLKMQKIEVREEILLNGIEDALAGGEPQMTPAQMRDALIELKKRADSAQQ